MHPNCCPKCESMNVCRSRRQGFLEKTILNLAGVLPMRCLDCKSRFFTHFAFSHLLFGK
jgi:hypothetical protein